MSTMRTLSETKGHVAGHRSPHDLKKPEASANPYSVSLVEDVERHINGEPGYLPPSEGFLTLTVRRLVLMLLAFVLALCTTLVYSSSPLRRQSGSDPNNGIHLAITPTCGPLSGSFANVNSGLHNLSTYRTIVAFGDSYTDTGGNRDGSPPPPPIVVPPDPEAGGRSTNGLVWVEDFALDHGNMTVMNYAISAAVTNNTLWPSRAHNSDFVHQSGLFLSQHHNLDPDKTLYVVFFGINDFLASQIDGNHLPQAAQSLLNLIDLLTYPPTNARNFLVLDVYGIGVQSPEGDAWKQAVFSGLYQRRTSKQLHTPFRVGFVDFAPMWAAINDNQPPGYQAFGYISNQWCLTGPCCTTINHCADPDHTWYWIPSHPAKEGMRLMADFVNLALTQCKDHTDDQTGD